MVNVSRANEAAVPTPTTPTLESKPNPVPPKPAADMATYLRDVLLDHVRGAQVGGALANGVISASETQARLTGEELFNRLPAIKTHLLSVPGSAISAAIHFDKRHLTDLRDHVVALAQDSKLAARTAALLGMYGASYLTLPAGVGLGATLGLQRINDVLDTISEGLEGHA